MGCVFHKLCQRYSGPVTPPLYGQLAMGKLYFTFTISLASVDRARGYKTFFVLNSVEHEISNAHKYKNIKKFSLFKAQLSLDCYFPRSYMLKCQLLLAF